jgi:uncharacterized protein (DUF1499 family)
MLCFGSSWVTLTFMNRLLWWLLGILTVAVVGYVALRALVVRVSPMPANLGVSQASLAPCPDTPNCVSSYATDAEHRVEPLTYTGDQTAALAALEQTLRALPRSHIVTHEANYLHAVLRSRLMGFIDDVEFYVSEPGVIQVRAAARLGQSDLGENRRYVATIRQGLSERLSSE